MKLVIFDWKWTLYHPPTQELLSGARELLEYLHSQEAKLVIIGKDQGGDMHAMVDKLGVRKYFDEIRFIAEHKSAELFNEFAKDFKPNDVWVVGDRVQGEIDNGNKIGANTVWMKSGKFAHVPPQSEAEQPNYTFTSLQDLLHMFSKDEAK